MTENYKKIHIGWCHHGQVDNYFTVSLLDLVRSFPDVLWSYNSIHGLGLLSKSRNMLVRSFLDSTEAEWLLMVDTDEFIPIGAFTKMLDAADPEKRPVISGLCFGMQTNIAVSPVPCIFKITEDGMQPFWDYPEDSVVEIDAAGTGCLLIHRTVLEKVRDAYKDISGEDWAWFQDGPLGNGAWLSEDHTFSTRLTSIGVPIHAHTGAVIPHNKSIWITDQHYRSNKDSK